MIPRDIVGGVSNLETKLDVLRRTKSGWKVFSEKTGKPLSRGYTTKGQARNRLRQIEYFKHRDTPAPPAQGTAAGNHPSVPPDPRRAAPDPNTPPTPVSGRSIDHADARPRLPQQIPPIRHEEDYAKALIKIISRARRAWAPVVSATMKIVTEARTDASDVRGLIAHAVAATRAAIKQPEIEALARKFAKRTGDYQKDQLSRQVKAAMGTDPVFKDKGMAARVDKFAKENVGYVVRIPERLHGDLEAIVMDAVKGARLGGGRGRNPETLRRDIEDRFDVSEKHARVIARDQIGKLYSAVNHARQKDMGVTRFVWRTVGDERTRPEHAELDGQTFSYDDPPTVEGEEALPGEQVQCRCWAEPLLDDLEPDEDQQEPDQEDDDE